MAGPAPGAIQARPLERVPVPATRRPAYAAGSPAPGPAGPRV